MNHDILSFILSLSHYKVWDHTFLLICPTLVSSWHASDFPQCSPFRYRDEQTWCSRRSGPSAFVRSSIGSPRVDPRDIGLTSRSWPDTKHSWVVKQYESRNMFLNLHTVFCVKPNEHLFMNRLETHKSTKFLELRSCYLLFHQRLLARGHVVNLHLHLALLLLELLLHALQVVDLNELRR